MLLLYSRKEFRPTAINVQMSEKVFTGLGFTEQIFVGNPLCILNNQSNKNNF